MRRTPPIVAGEPELHCWCQVCQLPSRVRVPLHIGSLGAPLGAVLEICPGCGTGHDRPSVEVASYPALPRRRPRPLIGCWRALHAWACRRSGLTPRLCAYGDCARPGLFRNEHAIEGADGTWRFVFCTRAHRRVWAAENGVVIAEDWGDAG